MSQREKIQKEFELLKESLKSIEKPYIKDLSLEDEQVSFVFDSYQEKTEFFTLHLSDYPESCVVYLASAEEPIVINGSLIVAVQTLIKDFCSEWNLPLQTIGPLNLSSSQSRDNKNQRPKKVRKVLTEDEEPDEVGLGSSSENWKKYNEDRYLENEILMNDINNFKKIYGEKSIIIKPLVLLEEVEILLLFDPLRKLDSNTARAWGVNPSLPICIRMTVSDTLYPKTQIPPTVELFQLENGTRKKFGLKAQLEGIMKEFVKEHWPGTKSDPPKNQTNEFSNLSKNSKRQNPTSDNESSKKKSLKHEHKFNSELHKQQKISTQEFETPQKVVDMDQLTKLVEMGFHEEMAFNALTICDTFEQAMNLLLENSSTSLQLLNQSIDGLNDRHTTGQKSQQNPVKLEDIFTDPDTYAFRVTKNKGAQIIEGQGFLVLVMSYCMGRLPTLNNYCVICDQPHVFTTGNMLKPAVCSRELCCWSFQQLKVGADAADSIATEAEVVDLLVCMANAAVRSSRRQIIFDPFPLVFAPNDSKKPALSPSSPNYDLVCEILDYIPSVERMTQARDFLDLREQLMNSHPLAYPLLQWIILSNRAHIVKLHEKVHIKSMETPHQYLLLSAPPEKEERFRKLKNQYSSCFAFHGSPIENWHSILRYGLKNASGTKLQMHGAAFGAGIYLSPHAGTSFGYSVNPYLTKQTDQYLAIKQTNNKFLNARNVYCIALCEVVNHNLKKSGTVWVQPVEDCVVTRFLFVYTNQTTNRMNNCNTEDAKFLAEVKEALKYYGNK